MNYLQVPSGSGAGNYYDFDITDFSNKFRLESQLVVNGIKALEQEELLSFNEQVFLPAKAQFVTGKDYLYEFENGNPALEPLIKTLLRTYEGIFDTLAFIHEKTIAFSLRQNEADVIRDLKKLHAAAIIEYIPQKDSPQLFLIANRVKTEDLHIKTASYEKRKKQYRERVETMMGFVNEKVECRSRVIASYFGDDAIQNCKICDNCLRQDNKELGKEEFEKIQKVLMNAIKDRSLPVKELLQPYTGIKKEKVWRVLEFLQAENKVKVDARGNIGKR
jgi:ATP-dependent DNA helicase RecQ